LAIRALADHGCVALVRNAGTSRDGSPVELLFNTVFAAGDGRITRVEHYPVDALDDAIARLEQLRRGSPERVLVNRCTRHLDAFQGRWRSGDWVGAEAMVSDDLVFEDRRPGLRSSTDAAGYLAMMRTLVELRYTGLVWTCMATRGERLALCRVVSSVAGPERTETVSLLLSEIDADGRAVRKIAFAEADLVAAFAELDERYLAGEGAPFGSVVRTRLAVPAAFNRRDWQALAALHAPGLVVLDHQARIPRYVDRDGFIQDLIAMFEVEPDVMMVAVVVHPGASACVTLDRLVSSARDGEVSEAARVALTLHDDALITRIEIFSEEDLEAATARLASSSQNKC
jgi:hypothetical protein